MAKKKVVVKRAAKTTDVKKVSMTVKYALKSAKKNVEVVAKKKKPVKKFSASPKPHVLNLKQLRSIIADIYA